MDTHLVTVWAIVLAVGAFSAYGLQVLVVAISHLVATTSAKGTSSESGGGAASLNAGDLAKMFEALAKLTDSLAKAGPLLTSIIAAVLFLVIAALSAGSFRTEGPAPAPKPRAAVHKVQLPLNAGKHESQQPKQK